MNYTLPKTVSLGGEDWAIRSDYRAALDICAVLSDPGFTNEEKARGTLTIFYSDFERMPPTLHEEALRECLRFLNCGEDERGRKAPKLVDWEQDFPRIVSAINKSTGTDVRAVDYLHWWTFISYYSEIDGKSTFAQIVRIRDKLRRHKNLDKGEAEFYRMNREQVDFRTRYTDEEDNFIKTITAR